MASAQDNVFVQRYLTPLAVLLAAAIIAVAVIFGHGAGNAASNGQQGAAPNVDVKNISTDGEPFIGKADAPVTMVVFFDYQCPFCKQFELSAMPQLMDYVNSGKVKVVFKDFQFLGQDSITDALYSRAFFELYPDKFGTWFSAMMNAQDQEGDQGFGDLASIQKLAATIPGVDAQQVTDLMNKKNDTYQKEIQDDYQEAVSVGVNGTPTIVVGKKLLSGLSPDQFVTQIKAELDAELQ